MQTEKRAAEAVVRNVASKRARIMLLEEALSVSYCIIAASNS
jgi:hypothetical protein